MFEKKKKKQLLLHVQLSCGLAQQSTQRRKSPSQTIDGLYIGLSSWSGYNRMADCKKILYFSIEGKPRKETEPM